MPDIKVRVRVRFAVDPVVGHDPDVRVAGQMLEDDGDAMVCDGV